MPWETVIGLEVHARLQTRSKMFCGCSTTFGAPPNSHVCPVCLGYPGALPVLNRQVVALALRMALATECVIHLESLFARKNYFYPDLPKGYQISQFEKPIATGGGISIPNAAGVKSVTIRRIHLEEDAGKLLHQPPEGSEAPHDATLIDLNRSGVPLIEIVSEPDLESAEEAVSYLTRLRQLLMYTDVCDGNMEEGSLRCDANISVRRRGETLGTRSEVKNLNSFRFLGRAIEFEVQRQIALLENGERIVQETRLFDPAIGETRAMRSKEEAHDYRYFPEPDLLPLRITSDLVEQVRSTLPLLPQERVARYEREYSISRSDAEVLASSRRLADYFEETASSSGHPRTAANWVRNEILRVANERKIGIEELELRPPMLAELIRMIEEGEISGKVAKEVFDEISRSGGSPRSIVETRGLGQISDPSIIRAAAERVIAANGEQVAQYRAGKTTLFGFFVGQLMKETRGKAKAEVANQLLRELLDR
ncbi:MAG TPA: Asp-tRNA(Asn)/Glu-tRNA(Gln) amidotransferase subunit GatB [Thermoanaerobaculia bacterium]|nr:Asp-tRNA(Asn)/Glu-tRNA(Gln) amidotransferase subunit GatB [Thermoanaerobaculia bacterium]